MKGKVERLKEVEGKLVLVRYNVGGHSEWYSGRLVKVEEEGIYVGSFFIPFTPNEANRYHIEEIFLVSKRIYP